MHLGVTVVNCSEMEWEQDLSNVLNVGNHRRSADSADDVYNDGRTRLPGRISPGGRVDLDLTVTAPQVPGRYDLAIDVVQEHVSWFEGRGAEVAIGQCKSWRKEPRRRGDPRRRKRCRRRRWTTPCS